MSWFERSFPGQDLGWWPQTWHCIPCDWEGNNAFRTDCYGDFCPQCGDPCNDGPLPEVCDEE